LKRTVARHPPSAIIQDMPRTSDTETRDDDVHAGASIVTVVAPALVTPLFAK